MLLLAVKLIHLFAVFVYGGFLFTDNLFFSRMAKELGPEEYAAIRERFMSRVRKVVPKSLIVIVLSGIYLFRETFGTVGPEGLSDFQLMLCLKAFLGLWLGLRGILQVFFGIQPLLFKSHRLPFILVIVIIALSQIMFSL